MNPSQPHPFEGAAVQRHDFVDDDALDHADGPMTWDEAQAADLLDVPGLTRAGYLLVKQAGLW